MQKFKNSWYPILLVSLLCFGMVTGIQEMLSGSYWISAIRIVLSLTVVIGFFLKPSITEILVKAWATIIIMGGILGLISLLMYLIIGLFEKINGVDLFVHGIHIFIGYMIFSFWNRSIHTKDTER